MEPAFGEEDSASLSHGDSGVSEARPRAVQRIIAALTATLVVGGVIVLISRHPNAQQPAPPPAASAAVPVTVTKVQHEDVPLWLRGIGTVQALNSVLVRPRVDGTLMQVPVTEGQLVKQGAVLAVIDPRPYQSVLDQAIAKKSQDEFTAFQRQA